MKFINLSHKPLRLGKAKEGLMKLITLPDHCPGRGVLPVGIVAVYDRKNHEISSDYLGPDVGCGMTLARFKNQPLEYLEEQRSNFNNLKKYLHLRVINTENEIKDNCDEVMNCTWKKLI